MTTTTEKRYLTRDEILQTPDRKIEAVVVPEWGGGTVHVKSLTGRERDELEASIYVAQGGTNNDRRRNLRNFRARLVAMAAVDPNGVRLFSDDDVAILGERNAAAIDRLFTVAQRLGGFTTADVDELSAGSGPE